MYVLCYILTLMPQTYKKMRYLRHIKAYFFNYLHYLSQKVLTLQLGKHEQTTK